MSFLLAALLLGPQQSVFKLNSLFSDHMILQENAVDPVFGTATPGAQVRVELGTQKLSAVADPMGRWRVNLKPLITGSVYEMTATSGAQTLTVTDIKVGEVWLASGQSNMEFPEREADDYPEAKAETNLDVRFFTVAKSTAETPKADEDGKWEMASPSTVGRLSAVGLAFAREVSHRLNVPVGIIHSSWGGTPAEAWISNEALTADPVTGPIVKKYLSDLKVYPARKAAYDMAMQMWIDGKKGGANQGFDGGWPLPNYVDSDWQTVAAGATTRSIFSRDLQGSYWFRKTITIPDEWAGQRLKLYLGALGEYDDAYWNGVKVGRTDQTVQNPTQIERLYNISPGMVHPGPNTIAIRVFNSQGIGGMLGPVDHMRLYLADGTSYIPLDDNWKFKLEQEMDPNTPRPHLPNGPGNPTSPSQLFNAMISPLIPYRIKGMIWYQGESNVGKADQYSHLFPNLIKDWRTRWAEGPIPCYYVQLANYMPAQADPGPSDWAALREAQAKALTMPQTGMAVTLDLGNPTDIHPTNKREVGRRLAVWALSQTYGEQLVYGSPMFRSMDVSGSRIEVQFANGSLITSDGQPPKSFAVAGEDRKFHWATASVLGSTVTLVCDQVPHPVAVRYAWADNPSVNLVNHAGLPAAPFRTDSWPE